MAILEKLGVVCIFMVAFQVIKSVKRITLTVFSKELSGQRDLTVHGSWAVISGGTERIGRAFVEAFASRGLNVIILDFANDELEKFTADIKFRYNVQAIYYAVDFSRIREIYLHLEKQLGDYEIGILVNAIGVDFQCPKYFISITHNRTFCSTGMYNRIINTNIYPVTHLCRIVLKGMYKRKRGIIINLSSANVEICSPMLAVYTASKAYISKFTTDLNAEYSKHGITIQCLQPGMIVTNPDLFFSKICPTPEQYVESAITSIGLRDRTCGFLPHSILLVLLQFLEVLCPDTTRMIKIILMQRLREKTLSRQYITSNTDLSF